MKALVLPREEWGRLSVTGLPSILDDFRDEDLIPVVIEEGGEIVATLTIVRAVHLESLWIKPGSRAGVVRKLIRETAALAAPWGKMAFAQSNREKVIGILRRLKSRALEVETYLLPLVA